MSRSKARELLRKAKKLKAEGAASSELEALTEEIEVFLKEEPDVREQRPRFRKVKAYANRRVEPVCLECEAPCCSSEKMNVVIEPVEIGRVRRGELRAKYSASVHPRSNRDTRTRPARGMVEAIVKINHVGEIPMVEGVVGWGFRRVRARPMVKKSPWGACIYFSSRTNSCTIYSKRPLACRCYFCGRGTHRNWEWESLGRSL